MRWPEQPRTGTSRPEPQDYVSRRRAGRWLSGAGVNPGTLEPSTVSSGPGPDPRALRLNNPAASRCSCAPACPAEVAPDRHPDPARGSPSRAPTPAQIGSHALLVSGHPRVRPAEWLGSGDTPTCAAATRPGRPDAPGVRAGLG
ncbi:hypothetical protein P7K49_012391 [Saguinus oedipus]|uniref:Uncharacterized protein n=1 Tax=Saguinus oedipus TaxID=9490 RepID=A0ABQ9VUW9_SAGOE|nr:hypothetical protein P7K49_012391 [Saguinus oedipus]